MNYINIIQILKNELIGNSIRYCSYDNNIYQDSCVEIRKNGVTHNQFSSEDKKYRTTTNKRIIIGRHKIFSESKIKNLRFSTDSQMDQPILILELENNDETVIYL